MVAQIYNSFGLLLRNDDMKSTAVQSVIHASRHQFATMSFTYSSFSLWGRKNMNLSATRLTEEDET